MAHPAWLCRSGKINPPGPPPRRHVLFGAQLVLNAAWSIIFFGARNPGLAFGEILLLWCVLVATIIAFWRHSRVAAALLVPYLAWSSFAACLNFTIWRLN